MRFVEVYGQMNFEPLQGDVFYMFMVDTQKKLLAYDTDELTGLPRQRRFLEHAEKYHNLCAITHSTPVYIYYDLSNFKMYNLNYGEANGDVVLQEVAALLEEKYPNGFVARAAEDHFLVLTDSFKYMEIAQDVLDSINTLRPQANIFGSAGICIMEEPFSTPEEGVNYAREACDSVRKESNVRIQVYSAELSKHLLTKAYVIDHIDEAVQNDWIKCLFSL